MENKYVQKAGKYHCTSQTSKGSEAGGVKTLPNFPKRLPLWERYFALPPHVPVGNSSSQKPCVQSQSQSPEACGSTDMMSLDSFWDP